MNRVERVARGLAEEDAMNEGDDSAWPEYTRQAQAALSASGADKLAEAVCFLLDRLEDHENAMTNDDDAREWYGHVLPAYQQARAALAEWRGSE